MWCVFFKYLCFQYGRIKIVFVTFFSSWHYVVGNKILEINERLVDLSKPFLTEEAVSDLDDVRYTPIDPEGRSFTNLKRIINDNHMNDLLDDNTFSNFFSIYNRIITIEKKRFENSVRN